MTIPSGIMFGSKVVVVPGYASGFTHSANIASLLEGQNYRWVQRGEPIGEFRIRGSFREGLFARLALTKLHTAAIRCPVSGLLLHTTLSHELSGRLKTWNTMEDPPTAALALLLPNDEPKPEPGDYLYSAMCRLAREMKHYYFQKSRHWSMNGFSPEMLDELIAMQLTARPRIFDGLPRWGDYLDEARTRKPELRPYLNHLT